MTTKLKIKMMNLMKVLAQMSFHFHTVIMRKKVKNETALLKDDTVLLQKHSITVNKVVLGILFLLLSSSSAVLTVTYYSTSVKGV